MKLKTTTVAIYLLTSAVTSAFMLPHNPIGDERFALLPFWLAFFALPLLFVFAYPLYLFAPLSQKDRRSFALILNVLGAAAAIFLFARLASSFWENPLRDFVPLALLIASLVVLAVFLVAALSLLFRKQSSIAAFASVLVWPYFFLLALSTLDRFFEESPLHTVFYFLCFLAPALFSFAAGAAAYRPRFAHAIAVLAGLGTLPWIYWAEIWGSELQNPWIMFNASDKEMGMYPLLHVKLTILAVAFIVLATATAVLRLLPPRRHLRKSSLSESRWPAYAASFLFLGFWFSQSVMPYRIPGAIDYSDSPILQILHVEKHGLQFHETSFSVSRREFFSVSSNDRQLFRYRFQQRYSGGQLPQALVKRVHLMLQSPDFAKSELPLVKPLRAWNAEGWYLQGEGSGFHFYSYTTENGTVPPQEVVALFRDLDALPRSAETQSERKDVCLGFCYDPLSGMGYLYSNQRCFNDGRGFHCR